ncbi:MAG: hypothetical protein WBP79_07130 [Candidatus Acidiferrales bacterium]
MSKLRGQPVPRGVVTRCVVCFALAAIVALVFAPRLGAQTDSSGEPYDVKPVPILSAGMGFITPFEGGQPHLEPLVAPVVLVPIGRHWLAEARATFESDLVQPPGGSAFRGEVEKEVDYAQLDYIASRYATVTVGRYLTPFGVYNERLYPVWIRDLQSDPLILPIATGPSGAGTGAMVRGGFSASTDINLNYAAYFSTVVTNETMSSNRFAGGRIGIYLPKQRLEVGGSFQHLLQDERSNSFGFHFAWQPAPIPLDLRAEYARSANGSGYWIESAYRLTQVPVWQNVLGKVQIVGRMQQFFTGELSNDDLPGVNTRLFEFGLNYYFRYDLRFVSSYGRQFSSDGNENVWTVGMTYRFVLPLGRGEAN